MSHIPSTIPPSNFQLTFSHALRTYMKRTREDLLLHPLAARLQMCDSPRATLSVLQDQAKLFGHSPSSEEGLTRWLGPTVNVLYSLSISVGEDNGLVLSPAKAIFVGTGVLLSSVGTTQDTLLDVFNQMELFFRRLEAYPEITNAKSMKDINEKILLAVLSILTIVTEEIKQGRAKRYFKKLVGRTVIGDMIQRLDRLTLEEAQMVNEVLNISHGAMSPSHSISTIIR
ncbi:hypothetical protein BC827DRAFT_550028 [Russula dissimulans]|nr:hypothetical protein BC827DRAFT_550028 [Russula dissimulans]